MKLLLLFLLLLCLSFSGIYAQTISICVIGDAGNGSSDQTYVASALEKEACQFILYTGDVIYEDGITSATDKNFTKKFYNPYKNLMEKKKVKFYMSMGNHDWSGKGDAKHWITISKKYAYISFPNYYFSKQIQGKVCLASLETNEKNMFKDGLTWWEENIKQDAWKQCSFYIGFGHVPYYSSGGHGDASGDTKKFLEDTVLGNVDLYVAGHDHNLSDEGDKNGTRLLVSGCGGKKSALNKTPRVWGVGSKVGYLVLDITDTTANYKFVTVSKTKTKIEHTGTIQGKGPR